MPKTRTSYKKGHKVVVWNKGVPATEEVAARLRVAFLGHKHTPETRKYISKRLKEVLPKGDRHPNWKGGRNATFKRYRAKHGDRVRFWKSNRRFMKKGAMGSHTYGEWELLKKQYGYRCPCCGLSEPRIKLTEDHIIPIVRGGLQFHREHTATVPCLQ